MRSPPGTRLAPFGLAIALAVVSACVGDTVSVPNREGAVKSAASVRAERRAYDGAPPTVPHESFGMTCSACHNAQGQSVAGVGFVPASPHESTSKAGNTARCAQCHVFVTTDNLFVESEFVGLAQDLSAGGRATPGAPPTIPHRTLMPSR